MEAPTGGSCTGVPGLDLEGGALLPGVLCSLEGGALLPGVLYSLECSTPWREVLYSLEGGAPLETSGGVTISETTKPL